MLLLVFVLLAGIKTSTIAQKASNENFTLNYELKSKSAASPGITIIRVEGVLDGKKGNTKITIFGICIVGCR